MNLDSWLEAIARRRHPMILITLVMTFAGFALIIDRPKGTLLAWIGLPLLVAGGALFACAVWPRGGPQTRTRDSLASRLLDKITLGRRLVPLFPAFGVGIILADLGYNWLLSASPAIQTEDTIVLLAAASLIAYRFVPSRFARERDFVLLFFLCLNAILVVPLLSARAYYADFERSVDLYSWVALAPETSAVLQLIGVSNTVHPVTGSTAPGLTFTPKNIPTQVTVVISTACSGIYSFGIFASAFVGFVLTEYQSLNRRVWALLGLGLGTAYVANVLRMVVIVLVGYYADTAESDLQNMLIAHSYAGWLIFLGWIALFWGGLLRLAPPRVTDQTTDVKAGPSVKRVAVCAVCAEALTPLIPSTRCHCGAFLHRSCLSKTRRCLACGRGFSADENPLSGAE